MKENIKLDPSVSRVDIGQRGDDDEGEHFQNLGSDYLCGVNCGYRDCKNHLRNERQFAINYSTTQGAGLGCFLYGGGANQGDILAEYTGEIITKETAKIRNSKYILCNGKYYIDAEHVGSIARFINHARKDEKCNVEFRRVEDADGTTKVVVVATADIQNEAELYVDYGPNYKFHAIRECKKRGKDNRVFRRRCIICSSMTKFVCWTCKEVLCEKGLCREKHVQSHEDDEPGELVEPNDMHEADYESYLLFL